MKKLIFFISLLFIFSILSCGYRMSDDDWDTFMDDTETFLENGEKEDLEKRVQAHGLDRIYPTIESPKALPEGAHAIKKLSLDRHYTIKKVVLSRTGEFDFEGYIDYCLKLTPPNKKVLQIYTMEISVTLSEFMGDFIVRER